MCPWLREQEKTEVFKQLTEAYNVLSNEHRRKQYDSSLGISKVGPALMAPSRSSVVHA